MYKALRKKLGTSISELEMPEHYQISKWLNKPKHSEEEIGIIISFVEVDMDVDLNLDPVEINPEIPDLVLEEPKITSFDSMLLEKQKTDYVLFGFGKTEVNQIKYAVIEGAELSLVDETFKKSDIDISEVDLPVLGTKPKLYKANTVFKLPSINEIELLKPSSEIRNIELLHPVSETRNIELLEPSSETENIELLQPSSVIKEVDITEPETVTEDIEFTSFNSGSANVVLESVETETIDIEYHIPIEDSENIDFSYDGLKVSTVIFQYIPEDTADVDFKVPEPEIIDHLAKLIPEIYKIDLLSLDDMSPAEILDETLQKEYEILDKAPKIISVNLSNFFESEILSVNYTSPLTADPSNTQPFKKGLYISTPDINEFSLNITELESDDTYITNDIIDDKEDNADYKYYKRLIEPSLKIDEVLKNKIFNRLYPYQRIGSEFLTECEFALLTDEYGLGKTIETVGAIKLLWNKRTIQSALIITDDLSIGDESLNESLNSIEGWIGVVKQFAPELILSIINENDPIEKWQSASNVFITTYSELNRQISNNTLSKRILKSFDCLVLDDIHEKLEDSSDIENILAAEFEPYYYWLLSSIPEDYIQQDIKALFNRDDLFILGRSKAIVKNDTPEIIRKDYWLKLTEIQKTEYEEKFASIREELSDILFLGDPFRFQANVFRALHDLQQIYNFSSESKTAPKTDLIIKHLNLISKWEKKVIIFTQFEKFGFNKIEKLLKKNNITFVKLTPSMNPDELNEVISKSEEDDNMFVYLCSIKTSGLKFQLPKVSYIINFDQWWNPASVWSMEKKILSAERHEALTIINYFIKDTYDSGLQSYLNKQGLTDKNLVGHLTSESYQKMINEADWTEILKLTAPGDNGAEKVIKPELTGYSTIEEVTQKMSFILTLLGFTINEMETGLQNYGTYIYAERDEAGTKIKVMAKCIFTDFLNAEAIQFHLKDEKFTKDTNKRLLITSGRVDENYINTNSRVTIIDVNKLNTFANRFGL
ncbi:MAG: DEAD/DEAH box helicase [Melioribacteraceae bacterium]|nr:DEAD/DEAH box helicase [Melioribacteraceae bacterium]